MYAQNPEFLRLSHEVVREATEGYPSDQQNPGLGTERPLSVTQDGGYPRLFVCFNGERPVPHNFKDPNNGIERRIHIVAHVNLLQDHLFSNPDNEPDRFYWITAEGDVILREHSVEAEKVSYQILEKTEIAELAEKLSQC